MFKKFYLGIFMLLFMGFIVSCGSKTQTGEITSSEKVTVMDKKGKVEVIKNPKVVVTFDYGVLDILENLGVEVKGLPKSALPTFFSKYKDDKYVDLGGLKDPDFEALNALKPDLIIISGRQSDMYDKFSQIATTIALDIDGSKYMEDFKRNVTTLSTIFGKETALNDKMIEIDKKVKEINEIATKNNLNALTLLVYEGNLSTFGVGSRYGLVYNELGFKTLDNNIEISTHGQQISFEYIVDKNPQYIFVIDKGIAVGKEASAKAVLENDLIKSTDAYKNGKILYMEPQAWYIATGGINTTNTMISDILNFIKQSN